MVPSYDDWDMILHYVAFSGSNIEHLVIHEEDPNASNSPNFVHANFQDEISKSAIIMVVVAGNEAISELVFRSAKDAFDWFSTDNIMSSSLWNIDQSSSFLFHFGYVDRRFRFEITESDSTHANDARGFFALGCDSDPNGLLGSSASPCTILYSPHANSHNYADMTSANSVGIYKKSYPHEDHLAFRFSSFSKVDFLEFFNGEVSKSKTNTQLYRHNNFAELFRNSGKMKLVIFDEDGNEDGVLIFRTRKEANKNSLLGMKVYRSKNGISANGKLFKMFGSGLDYSLNLQADGAYSGTLCSEREGVVQISCRANSFPIGTTPCHFETWFQQDGHSLADRCVVLYHSTQKKWSQQEFSVASRIEILFMPMYKVFSYPNQANMHVYQMFKNGDTSTLRAGDQKPVFRSHDIERRLELCEFVRLDIYGADGNLFQEVVFESDQNLESWFADDKMEGTTSWDLSDVDMISITRGYGRWFAIMNWKFACAPDEGFFLISCTDPCDWEQTNYYECNILYNPHSTSVRASEFLEASKVEIWTDFIMSGYKYGWHKVFTMEAFSGVSLKVYFETGARDPAMPGQSEVYPEKMYRHPDILDKLSSAEKIRFLIFDFDKENIVSEVVFEEPDSDDGFMGWFHWDYVHYSSLWDFSTRKFGNSGARMEYNHREKRLFYINSKWSACSGDEVYFQAVLPDPICDWEKWYESAEYAHLGPHQPPAFLYSDSRTASTTASVKQAGKIMIEVQ